MGFPKIRKPGRPFTYSTRLSATFLFSVKVRLISPHHPPKLDVASSNLAGRASLSPFLGLPNLVNWYVANIVTIDHSDCGNIQKGIH